jgi:ancient ubiquitous protein 1
MFVCCRYLPAVVKEPRENDVQLGDRVAKLLAADLGVVVTDHTASDKAEYEKRYLLEQSQPIIVRNTSTSELQRMAHQVGEVLPYVPHDVVVRDLGE